MEYRCEVATQLGVASVEKYVLHVRTAGKVALAEDGGGRLIVGGRERVHELYRLSTWNVETSFVTESEVSVSLSRRVGSSRKKMEVAFEEESVERVAFDIFSGQQDDSNPSGVISREITNAFITQGVSSVAITDDDVLLVNCDHTSGTGGVTTQPEPAPAPTPTPAPTPAPAPQPDLAMTAELERLRSELEAERQASAAKDSQLSLLQRQLEAERRNLAAFQGLAASNLDQAVTAARTSRDQLSADLAQKLSDVEAAEREATGLEEQISAANDRIAGLETRLAGLRAERERLEPLEEAHTLDCDQASADLEELRARFGANEGTAQLMQTDQFLSGNSVRKTLGKVTKELESIERRIGLIITYRETFLNEVQQAMVNGDGSLPLGKDLERGYDGDDGEPEETDQES